MHERPVPLTGGPTLLFSTCIGIAVTLWFFPRALYTTMGDKLFLQYLCASGIVLVGVGMLDDRYQLRGRQKLFGQFLAAVIMLPSGITMQQASAFGLQVNFGDLAPLITVFWLLGAINALNLIDGVDGLASTTGIVLSLSLAAVAIVLGGRPDGLLVALVLSGALSGFLFYNFPPAKMFLGDSGSMLIGLILGAVALKCSMKQYTAAALVMPAAIWAIPIFDVSMAIVRRKLTGRSIYTTDRGHLHHCLQRRGHGGVQLLLVVGSLCALTGIGAVLGTLMHNEAITIVAVFTAFALLVLTRTFGHSEMSLLRNRVRRLAGSMVRRPTSPTSTSVLHDEKLHLHGDHDWEELWQTLTDFAARFEMDKVEMMVNLPMVGEEYHASWQRRSTTEQHEAWKSEIPLIVEDMRVGHLKVIGAVGEGSICEWMSELIGGLRKFEDQLILLIRDLRQRRLQPESTASHMHAAPPAPGSIVVPQSVNR
ncbi:MAG: MraY family glycosyltransferase [Planctomycetaceae bacterium]